MTILEKMALVSGVIQIFDLPVLWINSVPFLKSSIHQAIGTMQRFTGAMGRFTGAPAPVRTG